MNTSLSRVVETALPVLAGTNVTYNAEHNIFLSNSYTSAAGNTYYQGIRLSDRIIVKTSIGEGYVYTFLNGVQVYAYNGRDKVLIGSRCLSCCCYNEDTVRRLATDIVQEYVKGQAKLLGTSVPEKEIEQFSKVLVEDTYKQMKCLA